MDRLVRARVVLAELKRSRDDRRSRGRIDPRSEIAARYTDGRRIRRDRGGELLEWGDPEPGGDLSRCGYPWLTSLPTTQAPNQVWVCIWEVYGDPTLADHPQAGSLVAEPLLLPRSGS
jgi:hypothetical protein